MIQRDLRLREIFAICCAVYAVWTPVYFLAKPDPLPTPDGERVERILPFGGIDSTGRVIRGFAFRQRGDTVENSGKFAVYENSTPLSEDRYAIAPFNIGNRWRDVKFQASDGSDHRYNGRSYYAVIPRDGQ